MNPSETCLFKNKVTEAFIYDSDKQYLIPEKHEKYSKSDLEKLRIQIENSSNNKNQSSSNNINIFITTQVINKPNDQVSNNNAEKMTLLREIEHIIEDLEYFEKERRKNQVIEIMKSITRNVDKSTIPTPDDLLDEVFLGKSQNDLIDEFILREKLIENQKRKSFADFTEKDFNSNLSSNFNSINNSGNERAKNLNDINKMLMDDDKVYHPKLLLKKKTHMKYQEKIKSLEKINKKDKKKDKIFENVKKYKIKDLNVEHKKLNQANEKNKDFGESDYKDHKKRAFYDKVFCYDESVIDFDKKKMNK